MRFKNADIETLVPYENNPRINEAAVEHVARSIAEYGFKVPIVVDKDMVIIAGHTRLEAAKSLGLKTVPVIVADDLTEQQAKEFRLVDNRTSEMSFWDIEKLNAELMKLNIENLEPYGFTIEAYDDWFEEVEGQEEKPALVCPYCGAEI
jgi:ParB/RepB/Spo0J family partition protein